MERLSVQPQLVARTNTHYLSSIKLDYGKACVHVGYDSVMIEAGRKMTLKYEFIVGSRESIRSWRRVCYKNWHDLLVVAIATINKLLV